MSQIEEVVLNTCEESEVLPVLPLRGLVAFPEMLIHFDVGRLISMKALEQSMQDNQRLFLTAQRDIRTDAPTTDDLFVVGTVCTVKQILRLPGDNIRVLVEGSYRAGRRTVLQRGRWAACVPAFFVWKPSRGACRSAARKHWFAHCRTDLKNMQDLHPRSPMTLS